LSRLQEQNWPLQDRRPLELERVQLVHLSHRVEGHPPVPQAGRVRVVQVLQVQALLVDRLVNLEVPAVAMRSQSRIVG
jgi:hypothetical protein